MYLETTLIKLMLAKLMLAMVMGGIIGFERQSNKRPAGLKTHILVTLGATLVMILSTEGFGGVGDPARLAAQVVSGVGFLGAGTILVRGKSVYGLTTAASLWICACLGLAIGIGFYKEALMTLGVVLFSLGPLNALQKKIFKEEKITTLNVMYKGDINLEEIYSMMTVAGVDIEFIKVDQIAATMTISVMSDNKEIFKKAKGILLTHHQVLGFEKVISE